MKDNPGYSTGRTAAGDPAVIGNGNGPIGVSSTRALRDPGSKCIVKMSRGDVTWSCQGYGFLFPKDSSNKPQASSPVAKASSLKPQASSSKILDPRKSFTDPEPRDFTKINVFLGCCTWNAIWCGEKRTELLRVTFSSTVKKCWCLL